jgi:dihydroflavonol-4-reductase
MADILVTGANGFLAGNVIAELLARGYIVRGMLRAGAKLMTVHQNLEPCYGNITSGEDVSEAVKGISTVVHIAAVTDQSIADNEYYRRVNVGGTLNIIKASIEHRVKRVIYVGTVNSFGYGTKTEPGDETFPVKHPFDKSAYAMSKTEAQDLVLESFKGTDIRATVVNPSFMIGPDDHKISSNKIILRALNKRILIIPPGGKSFIYVKDVAKAVCNAISSGANGECYILSNENLSYREFYEMMFGLIKKRPVMITLPKSLLLAAGLAGSLLRSAGINTPLSLTNMKIISTSNYYSPEKARNEISLTQTPIKEAIRETINWFRKQDKFNQG